MLYLSNKPDFNAVAVRLIQRNSVDCVYSSVSAPVYDESTMQVSTTSQTFNIKARPTQGSYEERNSPNLVGLELCAFLIAGDDLSVQPKPEDSISYAGNAFTVLKVQNVMSNNQTTAYYRILTKRG